MSQNSLTSSSYHPIMEYLLKDQGLQRRALLYAARHELRAGTCQARLGSMVRLSYPISAISWHSSSQDVRRRQVNQQESTSFGIMRDTMAQSCKQEIKSVRDDNIMGTNNSSIVSKRSVERLYYSEPHYFRYFVKKPRRRSPLINRGYWLRMQAIDNAIRSFLKQNSPNKKLIINLGCGS